MGNDRIDFSNEIWTVLDKLTAIMDRMTEELNRKDDSGMKKSLRALASSQGQLLKAISAFDKSYKIPLDAGETWEHFLAKNYLVKEASLEHITAEFGLGGCVLDVLARIDEQYVIIEAETVPPNCVEKARKIKEALSDLASKKLEALALGSNPTLSEIKKQLEGGKPIRLIFVVTRQPQTLTLKSIKKEEDTFIRPEVYYVNRIPPFEKSSNLLDKIHI